MGGRGWAQTRARGVYVARDDIHTSFLRAVVRQLEDCACATNVREATPEESGKNK